MMFNVNDALKFFFFLNVVDSYIQTGREKKVSLMKIYVGKYYLYRLVNENIYWKNTIYIDLQVNLKYIFIYPTFIDEDK